MGDRKRTFEERLQAHPHLRDRVHQILNIAEDAEGKIDKADEAEERVIEELRKLGQEVLQNWAVGKEEQKVAQLKEELDRSITGHGKKNSLGTQRLEK
jgi:G:T-mismatch repair DNA endonuclease (very short patch repair protein)